MIMKILDVQVVDSYYDEEPYIDHKCGCGHKHGDVPATVLICHYKNTAFKIAFFVCPDLGACVEDIG